MNTTTSPANVTTTPPGPFPATNGPPPFQPAYLIFPVLLHSLSVLYLFQGILALVGLLVLYCVLKKKWFEVISMLSLNLSVALPKSAGFFPNEIRVI